jgi:hypothetical protein
MYRLPFDKLRTNGRIGTPDPSVFGVALAERNTKHKRRQSTALPKAKCRPRRFYYLNTENYPMPLHTATGSLAPVPPFDFDKSLDFLGFFAPMEGEQTLAARAFAKAVLLHEQIVVFEIAVSGSIEQPRLAYTLHSDQPISDATRLAAEDRIAFFFSLNDDLRPFYAIGLDDQSFAPVIRG